MKGTRIARSICNLHSAICIIVIACAAAMAFALVDVTSLKVIGSFSTDLAPRSPEQRHNIVRAASKIDVITIRPGAEFSFNGAVGLCGMEQGYMRAPAIVAGELRPEWGGGVCQVSSTLYNAVLLSDLKITERHAHSRRVSSVPPGRDATTAFGIADLKFVNTTGYPLRLHAKCSENRFTVSILGKGPDRACEIRTETAGDGTVITRKFVNWKGGGTRIDLISRDTYPKHSP
ncbi:MAG: VanW family protein [Armatimonadetes bacterium]|nr:VanW family protein [Armatimonadota bacterium]